MDGNRLTAAALPGPFEGELPTRSAVSPDTLRDIIRLDEDMMVWSDDGAASVVESIMPFFTLVGAVIGSVSLYAGVVVATDTTESVGMRMFSASLAAVLVVGSAVGAYFAWRISFGSRHSDIYFLRKQRKIYHYTNKTALLLDWDAVRPYARLGSGSVQLGSRPVLGLELVEYLNDDPSLWRARFVVDAPLPGREACQQSWELIRRYMDEAPDALPPQTVVTRDAWTSRLLEFGPLSDGGDAEGFLQGLREHNWQPFWNGDLLVKALVWIAFWPDPVFFMVYAYFRRRATLPDALAAACQPRSVPASPYATTPLSAQERQGRRKAAIIVAGVCAICVAISLAGWSVVAYQMLRVIFN